MTNKISALDVQIEGSHYKKLKMQPIELAYKVQGSPCFTKLAKYITRDKGDKLVNLKKARHCIELERDLVASLGKSAYTELQIGDVAFDGILSEFSDGNEELYMALYMMYYGQYESAIKVVNIFIKGYE